MVDLEQLRQAIVDGDAKRAIAVTEQALAEQADPGELVIEVHDPRHG